jgi:hypothetical protein
VQAKSSSNQNGCFGFGGTIFTKLTAAMAPLWMAKTAKAK